MASPRYPPLHQQPIFTEGLFARLARLEGRNDITLPAYRPDALPKTEAASREFLRLPTFPSAERELLDQYVKAFEKVLAHAEAIAAAEGDGREPEPTTGLDESGSFEAACVHEFSGRGPRGEAMRDDRQRAG